MTHHLSYNIRVSVSVEAAPVFQLEYRSTIRIGRLRLYYWAMIREQEALPADGVELTRTLASVGQFMLDQELQSESRLTRRRARQLAIRKRRQYWQRLTHWLKAFTTSPSPFISNPF
ncbi:hypothetical protein FAES_3923 [Fibrella aestuarina BUZ 2]|uniref:Uncharacterized protein n=1 Tax=Fibrella aestuarina BUZ 2 TaxID=1166018 RepID=I0KCS6_9BACT|nr:hypothetical protein [Fibrella aestuarina]CCH01929.1 hypothetical protein FAES_3923 [Fibrella aestuarina BUZ 2]